MAQLKDKMDKNSFFENCGFEFSLELNIKSNKNRNHNIFQILKQKKALKFKLKSYLVIPEANTTKGKTKKTKICLTMWTPFESSPISDLKFVPLSLLLTLQMRRIKY